MRVGIIGTGRVASEFFAECSEVDNVRVSVIYNPHRESVVHFAKQNNIKLASALEQSPVDKVIATDSKAVLYENCDSVYVASPSEYHVDDMTDAINAGKHILCESPFALSGDDAIKVFELARTKQVMCMEAIKTAYAPGFSGLVQLIEDGVIGEPYDIEATITRIGSSSGREMWGQAGGSFAEFGSYAMLPIAKIMGTESLESYIWSLPGANGNDSYTKTCFSYRFGTATAKVGLGVKSEGALIISGENGYIKVPEPWWRPQRIEVHHEDLDREEDYEALFEGTGQRYEITAWRNACNVIDKNKRGEAPIELDSEAVWCELEEICSISPQDTIWMAYQQEIFQANKKELLRVTGYEELPNVDKPKIYAHRGMSYEYPENTLLSFKRAAELNDIAGIELDTQLTKDGEIVVIHDETVDRTTDGTGNVNSYTYDDLIKLNITPAGSNKPYEDDSGDNLHIPTLREVFELLKPYCDNKDLTINIELKNSIIPYEGMEGKVIDLVAEYKLQEHIIYSSFNHDSLAVVKEIDPSAETATLDEDMLKCIEGMNRVDADGVHPGSDGMTVNLDTVERIKDAGIPVRMWNHEEPLFGDVKRLKEADLDRYAIMGADVIMTNVPDRYLTRAK